MLFIVYFQENHRKRYYDDEDIDDNYNYQYYNYYNKFKYTLRILTEIIYDYHPREQMETVNCTHYYDDIVLCPDANVNAN